MRRALTIAGSDSGGGAGIQVDLKTFSAFGIHGSTVITAVTAQNTLGVQGVHPIPGNFVRSQIESVMDDIGADAVKTGMLPTLEIVEIVARCVREYAIENLVVDPVTAAQSGDSLASREAIERLQGTLFPLCAVITPNIPEAESLTGLKIHDLNDMEEATKVIHEMGVKNVLIKGGHLDGDNTGCDLFSDGTEMIYLRAVKISSRRDVHGTGCSFSAAIASGLAKGMPLRRSVEVAKEFITRSIDEAYSLGGGVKPVNPLHLSDDPER